MTQPAWSPTMKGMDRFVKAIKEAPKEDFILGALFGILTTIHEGPLGSVTICSASAVLWALGGAKGMNKAYRRVGCPTVAAASIALTFWPGALAAGLASFGALTLGYGIPTIAPGRPDNDPGSALGRLALKIAKGNEKKAHLIARSAYIGAAVGAFHLALVISHVIL